MNNTVGQASNAFVKLLLFIPKVLYLAATALVLSGITSNLRIPTGENNL